MMMILDFININFLILFYFLYTIRLFPHKYFGKLLYYNFIRLGPVGIKIGQILSHRIDFLSYEVCDILSELTNNVPCADTKEEIDNDIKYLKKFQSWEKIGSGCVATTYLIHTSSNTFVIKIKKKNIHDKIISSIERLHNIISLFKYFSISARDILNKLGNIFDILIKQSDFNSELQELEYFHEKFNGVRRIRVPKPYVEYCNENIIVMEYLKGIELKELDKTNREVLAKELWNFAFESSFINGHWHSDLHKGNLVFLDGSIGIIDFGITGKFTHIEKTIILNYTSAILNKNFINAARIYVTRMTNFAKVNEDKIQRTLFINAISDILKEYYSNTHTIPNVLGSVRKMSIVSKKYGCHFNDRFVEFELAFATLLNVLSELSDKTIFHYLKQSFQK